MNEDLLLVRVDASPSIGNGHLMRCVALSQAWSRQGGRVKFVTRQGNAFTDSFLKDKGIEAEYVVGSNSQEELASFEAIVDASGPAWVVLDGYHLGSEYQEYCSKSAFASLCFDDYGYLNSFQTNLVLNQNLGVEAEFYSGSSSKAQLLLGSEYSLLREEYAEAPAAKKDLNTGSKRMLLTFGAADPQNVTAWVLDKLADLDLDIRVVVGGNNPHREQLKEQVNRESKAHVELVEGASTLRDHMEWCNVAVTAAGSTCWEFAYMGIPTAVMSVAENQKLVGPAIQKEGLGVYLGAFPLAEQEFKEKVSAWLASTDDLIAMSARAQSVVDGKGADRVVEAMKAWEKKNERIHT